MWKTKMLWWHLGLQDDCQEYKFENVPIGLANLKGVCLDTIINCMTSISRHIKLIY